MRTGLVFFFLLMLTACNTVSQQKVDTTVDETVPIVCAGVDLAYAAFEAYKSSNKVDPGLTVKANATYFAAKDVCANPPTTGTEALLAVLSAASKFNAAIKAAKDGNGKGTAGAP